MFGLLVLATLTQSVVGDFSPCCAYNGGGSVVLLGTGVLNAFAPSQGSNEPTGPSYAAPMALGVSKAGKFTTVLFAAKSGPEDSIAGWMTMSNATNDIIFTFSNISTTGPRCAAGVGPLGSMVADYSMCAGSGLFPKYNRDFKVAGMSVGVFTQDHVPGASSA